MDKVLLDGKELDVNVSIKDAKVKLEVVYDGKQADVGVHVSIGVDQLLDKLAEKIPGVVDDAVIAVIKAALKAL